MFSDSRSCSSFTPTFFSNTRGLILIPTPLPRLLLDLFSHLSPISARLFSLQTNNTKDYSDSDEHNTNTSPSTLHTPQLPLKMAHPNGPSNGFSSFTAANQSTYFQHSTELADLGRARFDQDTAAVGDRDFALYTHQPVAVRSGRAPKGLENQVFAWNTFQYTTEELDEREALKGDLHEGQLHRQNRAARAGPPPPPPPQPAHMMRGRAAMSGSKGGGGMGGGRNGAEDALCAARKPEGRAPPLAKGFPEELDKSMFWDEAIV